MNQVGSNHDVMITLAKTSLPVNFIEPSATRFYSVVPGGDVHLSANKPYFVQLDTSDGLRI